MSRNVAMLRWIALLILMVPAVPTFLVAHWAGMKRDFPNDYNTHWQWYKFQWWGYYRYFFVRAGK